jgi:hypothetical protein
VDPEELASAILDTFKGRGRSYVGADVLADAEPDVLHEALFILGEFDADLLACIAARALTSRSARPGKSDPRRAS